MFRKHPLTGLFVTATITVAIGLVALGDDSSDLQKQGFLLVQAVVLGAWLACGTPHRPPRGATFVGGLAFLAIIVCIWNEGKVILKCWQYILPRVPFLGDSFCYAFLVGKRLKLHVIRNEITPPVSP